MNDNRTLDEIGEGHADNLDVVMKACEDKSFPSPVYAYQYRLHCVEAAFRSLGFSPQELITGSTTAETASDLINQAMVSRNIVVEDWSEHEDDDRKGLYLYKDNEIAFFIALVRKTGDNFIVKSNVKFS